MESSYSQVDRLLDICPVTIRVIAFAIWRKMLARETISDLAGSSKRISPFTTWPKAVPLFHPRHSGRVFDVPAFPATPPVPNGRVSHVLMSDQKVIWHIAGVLHCSLHRTVKSGSGHD